MITPTRTVLSAGGADPVLGEAVAGARAVLVGGIPAGTPGAVGRSPKAGGVVAAMA